MKAFFFPNHQIAKAVTQYQHIYKIPMVHMKRLHEIKNDYIKNVDS